MRIAASLLVALLSFVAPATAQDAVNQELTPEQALAPPSAPQESETDGLRWVSRPQASDFNRHYPREAMRAGVAGRAVVTCRIGVRGEIRDCTIISETPEGYGFGRAAVRLAGYFRAALATNSGRPSAGGSVTIPIGFRLS